MLFNDSAKPLGFKHQQLINSYPVLVSGTYHTARAGLRGPAPRGSPGTPGTGGFCCKSPVFSSSARPLSCLFLGSGLQPWASRPSSASSSHLGTGWGEPGDGRVLPRRVTFPWQRSVPTKAGPPGAAEPTLRSSRLLQAQSYTSPLFPALSPNDPNCKQTGQCASKERARRGLPDTREAIFGLSHL